jgi:hypothetical protein
MKRRVCSDTVWVSFDTLWVSFGRQRMKRRSGRLSSGQLTQLDNIGFSWGLHAEWESRYEVV